MDVKVSTFEGRPDWLATLHLNYANAIGNHFVTLPILAQGGTAGEALDAVTLPYTQRQYPSLLSAAIRPFNPEVWPIPADAESL